MATVLSPPIRTNFNTWIYRWTGTAPFRIWNNETQLYIEEFTEMTEIEIAGESQYEPPALEVFDSTEGASFPEALSYMGKAVIQWRGYKFADYYSVQRDIGAGYEELTRIQEVGTGYYKYTGAILETLVEAEYQIVMYDLYGNSSTTPAFVTLVTLPTLPDMTFTYDDGTGDLTIDEV